MTTYLLLAATCTYAINTDTIPINGNGEGRVFEGIGAVSAGASSRMLIDYPASYRSDILDYLFKPNFGAGFIYLKTEIGGDGNTTCGAEPSFARTRAEMAAPNYNRGYEYWLMREAANRNPHIELDALEWSMPGWFNGTWSADNAAYLVKFIEGAQHWGLRMKYIGGCWNERAYNRNWIVDTLRPLLNKSGFSHIGINAPEGSGPAWAICDELIRDTAFRNAVAAVSYHYPDSYMWREGTSLAGKNAFECGVPLWSGEDFSLGGKSWKNTTYLALNILKCYLKQKIVKVNVWCPIASMPDNTCFSSVGMMKGVSPWSGYYEVWPTIWAVAHFNQFVQPGWQYLDNGCGWLPGNGAYCTYKRPGKQGDYSIVAVTGHLPKKMTFKTTGLSGGVIHVWKSDSSRQFVQLRDIKPVNGVFTIQLDAASIYSLTTTTGQHKGTHNIPAATGFPTTYADNFDGYTLNQAPMSPKYFYDNSGAFEIYQAPGESKCLRQMLNNDITHWIPDECAYTFVAQGTEWENGEVAADVLPEENAFNGTGYAGIIIRTSYDKSSQANIPWGYRLNIYKDNKWKLETKTQTLAEGRIDANTWHRLRLRCNADSIQAFIDDQAVAAIRDNTYLLGACGLTSGWNKAKFDNTAIHYVPINGHLLSDWKVATASVESPGLEAVNAFDGNSLSKWLASDATQPQWLTVDLGRSYNITRCETFIDLTDKPAHYKLEYSTDNVHWQLFADRGSNGDIPQPCFVDLHKATARWVRITVLPAAEKTATGIYALKVYGH
ncbi:MAG: discoidin domain-containing protein [Chitinophaga sp.]|uniref:discoidin domain-containing protein n=1 Tax=Chitinophaga sp. TaxID=1869181 RepID=UPI001B0EE6A0|nr:discoidin domain-containing protein [Chitinophaga sp.]MBO9728279.1 discoidin domain-containing protein [Chitinophaga sp.]